MDVDEWRRGSIGMGFHVVIQNLRGRGDGYTAGVDAHIFVAVHLSEKKKKLTRAQP